MLFIMTSRAHSCGYVAIMVYYCYVVHQSEICNVCLVWNCTLARGQATPIEGVW